MHTHTLNEMLPLKLPILLKKTTDYKNSNTKNGETCL